MHLYILKLDGGNYYIGQTDDIQRTFSEHQSGKGADWTKLHKPLGSFKVKWEQGHLEGYYTIKYMTKYTPEKVRGGSFVSVVLKESELEAITKMMRSSKDCCFKCGQEGHFVRDCPKNNTARCFKCELQKSLNKRLYLSRGRVQKSML